MANAVRAGHDRDMNDDMTHEPSDTTGPRRLTRARDGRMITGVCSGVAAYFNVDPTLVRIGAAVVTLLTSGAGILLYAAAVLLIPEEGKDVSIAQELINKQTNRD